MVTLSKVPWIIPNIQYSLDYTKTTQGTAQVITIVTPSYPIRLQVFAYQVSSVVIANWILALSIKDSQFTYPTGTSQFNPPPSVFTLCGNVPTDYIDLPANSTITIQAYMNGNAVANGTLNLTASGKQILNDTSGAD